MRRLVEAAGRISWLRQASVRYAEWRFARWRKRNPTLDFAHFYQDDVMANIAKGGGHPTLGLRGFRAGKNRSVTWDRESFAKRGAEKWTYYAKVTEARPGKRCVDFGCGSVRVGQHAIEALAPGNYWGLDISDSFYEAGRKLLDPATVEVKAPRFSTISDQTLDEVRSWRPDAIFANAVIQHVPPEELPTFFQRLGRILLPGAVAAIVFIGGPSIERVKAMSWAYPDDILSDVVLDTDDDLEIDFAAIEGDDAKAFNGKRRLLRLRRPLA